MAAEKATAPAPPSRAPRVRPGPTLLTAEGVFASFEHNSVLRDVSLSLNGGEVVALMGRNGAGKSTLLRCLAGIQTPDRGSVRVGGRPPVPGRGVGLCPQTPEDILFKDTVGDEMRASLVGREDEVRPILEALGIALLENRHPRDLSAGERLLVAVGVTVAAGSEVLLLDEPTRGLDSPTKDLLSRFLKDHAAEGRAAMFASHDVELVAALADRVVMLAGGEVIAEGTPREVLAGSPVFAPQTSRVFGPHWMTPDDLLEVER
jgi:energy-coupling factor transport system ATP-binding protein